MTASQIRGLPVVVAHSGEDVAEVRDVIYSPESGRLVGVTLNKRGFFAGRSRDVLPAVIHAIGQDAVMVLDESSIVASENAPDEVGHPLHRARCARRRCPDRGRVEPGKDRRSGAAGRE